MTAVSTGLQCLCGSKHLEFSFLYKRPPEGETVFGPIDRYKRTLYQCADCRHYRSIHEMDLSAFYEGHYVDSTYGADGLKRSFDRINALPPERSDNVGRVDYINRFMKSAVTEPDRSGGRSVLDVGSGLCVFLHRMKSWGWTCTALDPDPRAAVHARDTVGLRAVQGDFMAVTGIGTYDLITFNKVLEHVEDPIAMLRRSIDFVKHTGFIYVELPDGEMAAQEGYGREEFFIEHHHVFSFRSFVILAESAGFDVCALERLREPSFKYTLRGFLRPR